MTEEIENWNVNESFMTNPSYNSLSKCQQELAILYLKAKCAPLSPFVLFLSSLSVGHFFSVFKILGVIERASLRRPTRPVLVLFVGPSLSCQGLLCYLIPHAPHKARFDALRCGAWKTSQNCGSPLCWKLHGDDPAEPRLLNPGIRRNSVRRNREGHLWTSRLPDTVEKTTGGPSRGLCGGRANNVKIIWVKVRSSCHRLRTYIHGIHFLNNWVSWHLRQVPDLSRVPFPQWNRGKVIAIMRGPWKDELKDLKWEEGAASRTQVYRSQFSFACITGTWRWLYHSHGEGNGTPLQYSCLENPRDGGAWWAAVYGITQSPTRLKPLSIPFPTLGWMNASTKFNTLIYSLWECRHTFHTPGRFVVVGRSRKKIKIKKIGKGEKEEVNRSLRWDC